MSLPAGAKGHEVSTPESERLRRKLAFVLPALLQTSQDFLSHPRVADLYPEYLFLSHCIIRASVPLMESGVAHAVTVGADDPVAHGVAEYLQTHIPEEQDHDEWLLHDLAVLGVNRSSMLARPPPADVAALVGAQYYWLAHYHPVALLGYIALLEGYPPGATQVAELQERTGYSPKAFRTLRAHAELDPDHRAALNATLDALPLQSGHRAVLGMSAMHSVQMFTRCLQGVLEAKAHP